MDPTSQSIPIRTATTGIRCRYVLNQIEQSHGNIAAFHEVQGGHGGKSDILLDMPRGMSGRDTAVLSNESHRTSSHKYWESLSPPQFSSSCNNMYTSLGYVYCPVNGSVHVDYETITVG
eukprot:scaffold1040_cov40-Cyclotella_meneghiniana.AAC.2